MLLRLPPLPGKATEAAAFFHAECLPQIAESLATAANLLLVFARADHTHRQWRLAAVQSLARENAPARVNAVASDDDAAVAAAREFLDRAPGITGQYLELDGTGAGNPAA